MTALERAQERLAGLDAAIAVLQRERAALAEQVHGLGVAYAVVEQAAAPAPRPVRVRRPRVVAARVTWYGEDSSDLDVMPDVISSQSGSVTCTSGTPGPDLAGWCRVWGLFTAPTDARLVQVGIRNTYDGGDGNPVTYITRPFFAEASVAQTRQTPWGPGGTTQITGDMLATDTVLANTLRSSGATSATAGNGYWLSAVGAPTFRIGDEVLPGNNYLYWNSATNELQIRTGSLRMDSTGIQISPSNAWDISHAYSFDLGDDWLGVPSRFGYSGFEFSSGGGSVIGTSVAAEYEGDAPNVTVWNAITAQNWSACGGCNSATAGIYLTATSTFGDIELLTSQGGSTNNGRIVFGGIPVFNGATSGSAGSLVGYINVRVGSTDLRLPVYNP